MPQTLTKSKIYIGINYHSFTFCFNGKKDANDKKIEWIKSFKQIKHIKITQKGIDIKIPGKDNRLIDISLMTIYGKDIINLMSDYKDLCKRLNVGRNFLVKFYKKFKQNQDESNANPQSDEPIKFD